MHYISSNIKKMMEIKGLSLSEMSRQTGVNKATISRWFNSDVKPRWDMIEKIASTYNIPLDFFIDDSFTEYWKLVDGEWVMKDDPENEPVYEVAAGQGRINDGFPSGSIHDDDYEHIKVVGDSMYPTLHDGDVLKMKTDINGEKQIDFAVVKINGDELTIKNVEIVSDGVWIRAENKEVFEDKFFSMQEVMTLPVTIVGRAVSIVYREL